MAEQRNGEWLYYLYGVAGFRYNSATYLFRKNVQGDITHVYKQLSDKIEIVAQYVYDAWGKCEVVANVDGIAELNPFRYRSYYFDSETNLYYLQTRYYDPETCRFINADDISYLDPETLDGTNLYIYCQNNPVNYSDELGMWKMPNWLKIVIGVVVIVGLGDQGQ